MKNEPSLPVASDGFHRCFRKGRLVGEKGLVRLGENDGSYWKGNDAFGESAAEGLFSNQGQGAILGRFHDFAFAGSLVVDAAQVQDAVDNDAVQFAFVRLVELLGVGAHGVQADEQVACDAVSFAIIEGDDIGVVIVLQVLSIHLQDFFIRAEDVGDFAYLLVVGGRYLFHPFGGFSLFDVGHGYPVGLITDHGCLGFNVGCKDTDSILAEEEIADKNGGDDSDEIGQQSAGYCMAGADDSHTAEVHGQDIEGGIGGTLEDAAQPAHKRVGSIGSHGIHHQAAGTASAQGFHQGGRKSAYKVAVDAGPLHRSGDSIDEVVHGSRGPEHTDAGQDGYQVRDDAYGGGEAFLGTFDESVVHIYPLA